MSVTVFDLSKAGQDQWTIESVVDYYCSLQGAELLNAKEEGRVPLHKMKLSRRMTVFLKQAVEQEILKAYEGSHQIVWAGAHLEMMVKPEPWDREERSYPYLMLAAVILHRAGIQTPEEYYECDNCWYKEAFEALESGLGMATDFKDHWYGETSGYGYFFE